MFNSLSTCIKIHSGGLKSIGTSSALFLSLRWVHDCAAAISGTALFLAFRWCDTLHMSELKWCLYEIISEVLWRYPGPRSGSAPQIQTSLRIMLGGANRIYGTHHVSSSAYDSQLITKFNDYIWALWTSPDITDQILKSYCCCLTWTWWITHGLSPGSGKFIEKEKMCCFIYI